MSLQDIVTDGVFQYNDPLWIYNGLADRLELPAIARDGDFVAFMRSRNGLPTDAQSLIEQDLTIDLTPIPINGVLSIWIYVLPAEGGGHEFRVDYNEGDGNTRAITIPDIQDLPKQQWLNYTATVSDASLNPTQQPKISISQVPTTPLSLGRQDTYVDLVQIVYEETPADAGYPDNGKGPYEFRRSIVDPSGAAMPKEGPDLIYDREALGGALRERSLVDSPGRDEYDVAAFIRTEEELPEP